MIKQRHFPVNIYNLMYFPVFYSRWVLVPFFHPFYTICILLYREDKALPKAPFGRHHRPRSSYAREKYLKEPFWRLKRVLLTVLENTNSMEKKFNGFSHKFSYSDHYTHIVATIRKFIIKNIVQKCDIWRQWDKMVNKYEWFL